MSTKPRDMETMEILSYTSIVDMTSPIVTLKARKLNYSFMNAEAAWILSGCNDVKTICKYCENMRQFSDDGSYFFGGYGPRFYNQRQYIINTLRLDPFSRQAVINIWRECPLPSKDIPCTLSWQFLIRGEQLDMIATMRSSDAWLGWPYDIFNQSMTAAWIALEIGGGLKLGKLYLNCGSQHLYERDYNKASNVIESSDIVYTRSFNTSEYRSGQELIDTLWERANGKLPVLDI